MSLALQKRLASSLLKCGQRKVWLDPQQKHVIALARSREGVRDLIGQDVIRIKPSFKGRVDRLHTVRSHTHQPYQRIKAIWKKKEQNLEVEE
eukprot:TRINITY_DN5398_c0_g1_i1.p1 TRINITY_DN5398_c0_g1~~TRINITY_DN5398_c0_g1_i1.p1  ORF type:complete len:108 (+),score=28.88 TRINITY_DN5398_c0_g1_i1:51-326(+)